MSWRPIPGWEGLYEVSRDGSICSRQRRVPHILRPDTVRGGYQRVSLSRNGKVTRHMVHHLVLLAFVGPRPDGLDCNHRNGRRDDNRPENLEWVTRSENERHKRHVLLSQIGPTNPRSVSVDPGQVARLRSRGLTILQVAEACGVSHGTIKRVLNGSHWSVRG